jgi:methionyl-tRNA formyltransferase
MKVVFFGTPDFAVPSLDKIYSSHHEVVAVVTAPDKERGRGRKVSFTPIKTYALEKNLKVIQPLILKDQKFVDQLKSLNADVFVIVAFKILPNSVFTIPPKGSFNLHGSLLPKYRGAAPIQWALMNGDKKTGVTTFFLKEKVDTGNILLKREIDIEDFDDFGTLHDKMSEIGSETVLETLNSIESGNVKVTEQDNSLATPAPKVLKETCKISWKNTAVQVHNQVRGLSPFPGAFFEHNEKRYKVFKSLISESPNLNPGEIFTEKKKIIIGTISGALEILEIQPEGRKRMTAEEFLRGYKF